MGWRAPDESTADDVPGYTRPLPSPGPAPGTGRGRRYLKRAAVTLVALVVVFALAVGVLFLVTPSAGEATQLARQQARQHGIAYPGPVVPENFARPLVATEDHRFYSEPGIDLIAVGRVLRSKLTGGQDQGGATIEQQLAKMLYTPGQSSLTAELEQITLAFKLNSAYSKQQILRLYAEVAYYGHGYYGLERASCGYFGHPASQLTVVQGAMLAGVVNAPSIDDPINDPANARARLTHVIDRMVAVGYLTREQGARALSAPLGIVDRGQAGCLAAADDELDGVHRPRRRRLKLLGRARRRLRAEHERAVREQPEHRADADADGGGDVVGEPVGVTHSVYDQRDDADLDEDPDHVQRDELHRLLAEPGALAVPERPVPVADERDDGGDAVGDDEGGQRSESTPRPERVLDAELDDVADRSHDAELGDLVDQHLKPGVCVTDQTQLAQSSRLSPSRPMSRLVPVLYLPALLPAGRAGKPFGIRHDARYPPSGA